jgi:hypothetical protein
VSILLGLPAITPETHLVILEGDGAAVPCRISSPGAAGISLMLLTLIDVNDMELQGRGEGEFLISFASLSSSLYLSAHNIISADEMQQP